MAHPWNINMPIKISIKPFHQITLNCFEKVFNTSKIPLEAMYLRAIASMIRNRQFWVWKVVNSFCLFLD